MRGQRVRQHCAWRFTTHRRCGFVDAHESSASDEGTCQAQELLLADAPVTPAILHLRCERHRRAVDVGCTCPHPVAWLMRLGSDSTWSGAYVGYTPAPATPRPHDLSASVSTASACSSYGSRLDRTVPDSSSGACVGRTAAHTRCVHVNQLAAQFRVACLHTRPYVPAAQWPWQHAARAAPRGRCLCRQWSPAR